MASNRLDLERALVLLNSGLQAGAFDGADPELITAGRLCTGGFMEGLQVRKVLRNQEDIYLLSFPQIGPVHGLVMRVIPAAATDLVARALRESTFLRETRSERSTCRMPLPLGEFAFENLRVFVSELLPGTAVTEICIGKNEAIGIAGAIRHTQRVLSRTSIGAHMISDAKAIIPACRSKMRRYIQECFGLSISGEDFSFLDILDERRKTFAVVVSDRSPANFVLDGERIGAYDFDLAFAGVPFEDWAWFIDDPRLNSSLNRHELVHIFCKDFAQATGESEAALAHLFYLSAVFVGIKQCCLMFSAGQNEMGNHYLRRAEESAVISSFKEAIILLGKLRVMPPRNFPSENPETRL